MHTPTVSIEVPEHLLIELAEIYGLDSESEAVELALERLANILEIEALNQQNQGRYWPDFRPGEYLITGSSRQEGDEMDA